PVVSIEPDRRVARAMGLKLILVSGRVHSALAPFVRALGEFDGVVGENGAVIEVPVGRPPLVLGARIAGQVRRRLRSDPDLRVEYGRVVTSVRRVDGPRAMDLVQGLPVSVIENVDRVMILPRGITKATGVHLALERLGLAGRGFAAIGDGENDVPMLREAALSGAVANATPSARSAASYRCKAPSASGVAEFVRGPLTDWRIEAAGGETRSR
ncbi:MAG: HAD hydrolase family protein, partial [Thermoplasmata archaeon]|nr:HAD hydrolase family protein [Thermoplasmata archaeon]